MGSWIGLWVGEGRYYSRDSVFGVGVIVLGLRFRWGI